ncbi:MAG: protein phosphatase 2C domain-containing protein [Bacteroidota bacterium]|nr:protein phosphatase 2C domain-containing protein [Bacteroidota bacterium]
MTDQYFGITDTGKQRENNEDAFIARQGAGDRFIIACVIDGVGGYAGGEIAARIARDAIIKRLEKPSGEIIAMLIDCFEEANERIIEEKQRNKEYAQMSCVSTLAIADITNNQFYYAHVGDTRLYLLRDKSLVKISHDQSFVGFLEDSGRLTEDEAMNHPKRNEINKALGFEAHLSKNTDYIETGQSPFLSGDVLLLCSDGLTDMVSSVAITTILTNDGSLKEKGKQLIDAANKNGGRDNITAVLVHNNKVPQQHTATSVKRENVQVSPASRGTEQLAKDAEPDPAPKSRTGLIVVLVILMLVFLASSVYLYFKDQTNNTNTSIQPTVAVKKTVSPLQIKLQKEIDNVKGKVLILSDTGYKSPVIISEAIQINKDTLLIKSKGHIVFQSDSGYAGPAFQISAKAKSITLDSLSFQNFNTAISLVNNSLELKNVQFVNCKQSVQSDVVLADKKYISGKYSPVIFKADSLPQKHK